jgi:hypothetical protein
MAKVLKDKLEFANDTLFNTGVQKIIEHSHQEGRVWQVCKRYEMLALM